MGAGRGTQRRARSAADTALWREDQDFRGYRIEVRENPAKGSIPVHLAQHAHISERNRFTISQVTFSIGVLEDPPLQVGGVNTVHLITTQKDFEESLVRALDEHSQVVFTGGEGERWCWYDTDDDKTHIVLRNVFINDGTKTARAKLEDSEPDTVASEEYRDVLRDNSQGASSIAREDAANIPALLEAMDANAKTYLTLCKRRVWLEDLQHQPVDAVEF